jgi:ATP-dependent RNA helicase DDX5/DBP2
MPFERKFLRENQIQNKRSPEEVERFRREKMVIIHQTRHHVPAPFLTFEEAVIPDYLMHEIQKIGFKTPTPIQS